MNHKFWNWISKLLPPPTQTGWGKPCRMSSKGPSFQTISKPALSGLVSVCEKPSMFNTLVIPNLPPHVGPFFIAVDWAFGDKTSIRTYSLTKEGRERFCVEVSRTLPVFHPIVPPLL
jgi:hypothetical protein